jgi:hypothetical protein
MTDGSVVGGRSRNLVLAAMIFAVSMTFIDQTIVSIAAPKIQRELGLSATGVQWAINAYLLSLAALFAFGGRLADTVGHRKMVTLGVVVFAGASALCGLTPKGSAAEGWIVAFRVVQGAGGAIMFPAVLAIVVQTFDLHQGVGALFRHRWRPDRDRSDPGRCSHAVDVAAWLSVVAARIGLEMLERAPVLDEHRPTQAPEVQIGAEESGLGLVRELAQKFCHASEHGEPLPRPSTNTLETAMTPLFDQLLGSWELVAYTLEPDSGHAYHPLGEDATGSLVYTPQRWMSVNIMRPRRPKWASPVPAAGTQAETAEAAAGYLAYAGRFTVDEAASVVEHLVTTSLFPNWIGETHRRIVDLSGDDLLLEAAAISDATGNTAAPRLHWRRIP